MKSFTRADLKTTNRILNQANDFYARWMELNWAITFITVCRSLGLGKERARRLFDDIRHEMKRHDEYQNVEYSMKELTAEFERLEIPLELFGTHESWERSLRRDQLKERKSNATAAESREMAEKLKAMKALAAVSSDRYDITWEKDNEQICKLVKSVRDLQQRV